MMKVNAKLEGNLLVGWGYASDDRVVGEWHNGLVVCETESESQLVDGHTHLVDGFLVLDDDYVEPEPPQGKLYTTEQEQINIELTKELADAKAELDTAHDGVVALTRMIADLKGGS